MNIARVPLLSSALLLGVAGVHAQGLTAPRVKSLPDIELPANINVPESGLVRVRVQIDADGGATVSSCDAERLLCDLVVDAIRNAEFEPATREGNPIPSEVSVDLRVRPPPPEDDTTPEAVLEPLAPKVEKELVFTETVEVEARAQAPIKLELEGIRNIPGTFGEPFRTLELLPGTVPVANGQPYVYVRGAPPSGTAYLYDDIAIPLLFHSALGPSTIHPGLIGSIELFSGAPPARYGGVTGGVVSATARRFDQDRVHGEADVRAIDVSGLLNVPMPKEGTMTFAGRYGFPNLILGALDVDADVNYWDYQYRTSVAMSPRSRFEVVAIGGSDSSLLDSQDPDETLAFDLQFHRVDVRFAGKAKRWDFLGTLLYGYDFSNVEDASGASVSDARANIHRIGPRFWLVYGAPKAQLRIGGEMSALFGPVECASGLQNISAPCDPAFARQERRIIGGTFVDANLSPLLWLDLSLGLRVDVWNTAGNREAGVSPRARATFHAKEVADLFVGWGLGVRPATFAIALPGLGDVPLEPGLQYANQTEGGIRFFLPHDVTFETRGYLNIYRDLRFVDVFTEPEINDALAAGPIPAGTLDDSADGRSYGLELLLQRPFNVGVSTLASYTLGFSDLQATALLRPGLGLGPAQQLDYTPSYDVRHVINAALAWQAKFGLILSARLFTRSGRAEGWLWLDEQGIVRQYIQRVPWFTRLDLMIAYEWAKPGRRMRISFEWINVTQARDAQQIGSTSPDASTACRIRWGVPEEPCPIDFTTAIWFPNLSFRAVF
jgi:hypothetical protein